MSLHIDNPTWVDQIYLLETTDRVLGGDGGDTNLGHKNHADRTATIKAKLDLAGIFVDPADHEYTGQQYVGSVTFAGGATTGDLVYLDSNGYYSPAIDGGIGAITNRVVGIADTTNNRVISSGLIAGVSDVTLLPDGSDIFLSDSVAGEVTGVVSDIAVGRVIDAATGLILLVPSIADDPSLYGWHMEQGVYANKTYNFGSQTTDGADVAFSIDGTSMYILAETAAIIYQYTLATIWDVSTASYASKSYDASTELVGGALSMAFSADGDKVYIVRWNTALIYQYSLGTPWDISTASYDSKFMDGSGQGTMYTLTLSTDGTKMYTSLIHADKAAQYTLGTPWDISTASYDSKLSPAWAGEGICNGLFFSSDGLILYIIGEDGDKFIQYNLSTAWDVSTAVVDYPELNTYTQSSITNGAAASTDGTSMYKVDTSSVYQYYTRKTKRSEAVSITYKDDAPGPLEDKLVAGTNINLTSNDVGARETLTINALSTQIASTWVIFNGEGTIAIVDSYNVSSIVDYGTGHYGVTIAENYANIDYRYLACARDNNDISRPIVAAPFRSDAKIIGTFRFRCRQGDGAADSPEVCVFLYGDF